MHSGPGINFHDPIPPRSLTALRILTYETWYISPIHKSKSHESVHYEFIIIYDLREGIRIKGDLTRILYLEKLIVNFQ